MQVECEFIFFEEGFSYEIVKGGIKKETFT